MSYTIGITGHKQVADADEGKAFEEQVVADAQAFVHALEGVTSATITGQHVGTMNLMESK